VSNVIPKPDGSDTGAEREAPAALSFDALYRRHAARVRTLVKAILGDGFDAEEATHDVLLRGHAALRAGRIRSGALKRWLHTTARRHALDLRKSRARARARDDRYARAQRDGTTGAPDRRLDAQHLTELLRRRHPEELELVARCLVLENDRADIARALGITQGTLSVRLHRAVARLRSTLDTL
jgi:RNA polymerase sigma factor (sigma-70 family)